jgi:hypothetical protein
MLISLSALVLALMAEPSATVTTDTCQMWFAESEEPPFVLYECLPQSGGCDTGTCHMILVVLGGGTTVSRCNCGGSQSNVECAGAVVNEDGFVWWDCEPNGCDTCANPDPATGPAALCFCS